MNDEHQNPNRGRVTTIALVSVLLAGAGYLCVGMESYCVLYPGIDTRYATGFSEEKFARIRPGMTRSEVIHLVGEPLGAPGTLLASRWSYTQDGKCRWADWAWLGREVHFEGDRVKETVSRVYYD